MFTEIANARARLAGAATVAEQADADAAINSALSRLLAIAENYPELKSFKILSSFRMNLLARK